MNQVLQAETMVVQQQQINVLVLVNNELLNKKLAWVLHSWLDLRSAAYARNPHSALTLAMILVAFFTTTIKSSTIVECISGIS